MSDARYVVLSFSDRQKIITQIAQILFTHVWTDASEDALNAAGHAIWESLLGYNDRDAFNAAWNSGYRAALHDKYVSLESQLGIKKKYVKLANGEWAYVIEDPFYTMDKGDAPNEGTN